MLKIDNRLKKLEQQRLTKPFAAYCIFPKENNELDVLVNGEVKSLSQAEFDDFKRGREQSIFIFMPPLEGNENEVYTDQ